MRDTVTLSKKLADYMKQGWVITDLECPVCGSPLLKKGTKYFCAKCNREVHVVEDEKQALEIIEQNLMNKIKKKILDRINELYLSSDFKNSSDLKLLKQYLELLKEIKG
ncbi:hypothetical protein DRN87_00030 [Candidatus Geothermarchaeota archaeon]|nr:MAG: hypothetical protein DRN87_00030 [Candidatus Geothermarchaeota archaeon]